MASYDCNHWPWIVAMFLGDRYCPRCSSATTASRKFFRSTSRHYCIARMYFAHGERTYDGFSAYKVIPSGNFSRVVDRYCRCVECCAVAYGFQYGPCTSFSHGVPVYIGHIPRTATALCNYYRMDVVELTE